jgi:short-subunit dehydrogenase
MQSLFKTNVYSVIYSVKHFMDMLKISKGKITIINSLAGVFGAPTRSLYACTKFALTGFFDSLRIEVARDGISVINVLPSTIDTEFRSSAIDHRQSLGATKSKGLCPVKCAKAIANANDERQRELYLPEYYRWIVILKSFFPWLIDRGAARKYGW